MTMVERLERLTELLLTLFDPRTSGDTSAALIMGMDEKLLREVCMIACTWVGQGLGEDADRECVTVDQIMDRVRQSLERGAAEFDRLDHEGGLFT